MTATPSSPSKVRVAAWQATDTTGSHNKYYRAWVAGSRVVFQYGRIGTVQATQVEDKAHPAAAIAAAVSKLNSKLNASRSNYVSDGPTLAVTVHAHRWSDARRCGHLLNDAYDSARHAGTRLAGTLSDGRAHVVALIGDGGRVPTSHSIGACARLSVEHPELDVTVAVLDAADAARLDHSTEPRARLLDLGEAEAADTADVLAAALRMWTPVGGEPLSHLSVCVENARMIFA